MVTLTNGSMWLSPPFPWSRSARWSLLNIARCLVFNIAGVARASAVSSAGSFPLHPLHSLIWMSGLDVVGSSNVPAIDTPSFVPRPRLACVGLEPLLHAGKRVVRASSTPISSAESAVHGTKAACKCRKLENGVSHRVPVLFVHPSALEPRPHGEIFLNFSASMALDCHVDIVFVRASSCCGLLR